MWKEYSNQDNGICLEFYVEDFDWFYPVEYVDDKDTYSFISLWRKSQTITAIDGKLCNNPLAYLPYVVKDRINKRTGKASEKENEIRALYCAFTEQNLNKGILYPKFKSDNGLLGDRVTWDELKISLSKVIIGSRCLEENTKKIKSICEKFGVPVERRL